MIDDIHQNTRADNNVTVTVARLEEYHIIVFGIKCSLDYFRQSTHEPPCLVNSLEIGIEPGLYFHFVTPDTYLIVFNAWSSVKQSLQYITQRVSIDDRNHPLKILWILLDRIIRNSQFLLLYIIKEIFVQMSHTVFIIV